MLSAVLQLHWLPVRKRVKFKLAVLVYKSLHGLTAPYLTDDCQLAANSGRRISPPEGGGEFPIVTDNDSLFVLLYLIAIRKNTNNSRQLNYFTDSRCERHVTRYNNNKVHFRTLNLM